MIKYCKRYCDGILLFIVLAQLVVVGCSFYGPREKSGVNVEADIIVYFKVETSNEQTREFWNEVISKPRSDGKGFELLPGIQTVSRTRAVQGHEAITIDFAPGATREQREYVLAQIASSPIVFKVLTNTVPSDVITVEE